MDSELLDRYLEVKSEVLRLQGELDRLRPKVAEEVACSGGRLTYGPWLLVCRTSRRWKFSEEVALLQKALRDRKRSEIESGAATLVGETDFVIARRTAERRLVQVSGSKEASSGEKGRLEKIRQKHARAYEVWTHDEEQNLQQQYLQGHSIAELAELLQRQPGGIRSRLRRLGLME